MQFNTYSSAGAHIAAEMVNAPEADASQLAALFASYQVHRPHPSTAQVAELRRWTDRLRAVFAAASLTEQATLADALLTDSDCRLRLVSHDGLPFHLHYAPVATDLAARVRALTAAGLAHVLADSDDSRLRACQRSGCTHVFVDTSRNGRRRFCGIRCANQVNVAKHRSRRRATSLP